MRNSVLVSNDSILIDLAKLMNEISCLVGGLIKSVYKMAMMSV